MPLRFLFGGRKEQGNQAKGTAFEDDLSAMGSFRMPSAEEEIPNETFFMNPEFGFSSPTPSMAASTISSNRLVKRQMTKRLSSKIREYRQGGVADCSEYDIDVEMAPSAFALHAMPNTMRGDSFCSRDDSEVFTRTPLDAMYDCARPPSGQQTPYVNALFLHNLSFNDDSDVGSCSAGKIPLRHMGSALSYRLSMSGTPDCSVYGDEDLMHQSFKRPGHIRNHSDASIASVKERNKMVCLESLVEAMHKSDDPVFEFGLVNPNSLRAWQEQPTPRLFRSASEKGTCTTGIHQKIEEPSVTTPIKPSITTISQDPAGFTQPLTSYPLFLANILEEEENEEEGSGNEENGRIEESECQKRTDIPPIKGLSSDRDSGGRNLIRSSFKVRVEPIEVTDKTGFVNPAFDEEVEEEAMPEKREKRFLKVPSIKRKKSMAKRASDDDSAFDLAVRRRGEKRDESLHVALLERFLVQSVVNKCIAE